MMTAAPIASCLVRREEGMAAHGGCEGCGRGGETGTVEEAVEDGICQLAKSAQGPLIPLPTPGWRKCGDQGEGNVAVGRSRVAVIKLLTEGSRPVGPLGSLTKKNVIMMLSGEG